VSFRDPGVRDFTVRRRERVFMMALMRIDFSIRIRIQSVVRNNDLMNVVSDNQNGQENDQRRNHDIETTQKPIPFYATKSLFFYVVFFFLLLVVVEALEHLLRLASLERRVAFPRTKKKEPFKFRVSYKTLNRMCAL
jgi:hypothetical protein